jgi:hypothetical protein
MRSSNSLETTKGQRKFPQLFKLSSQSGHSSLPDRKASSGVILLSFSKSLNDKTAGHVYAGLAGLFRLLRHSLGPVAIEGSSLAPMETPRYSTHGTQSLGGVVAHCAMNLPTLRQPLSSSRLCET